MRAGKLPFNRMSHHLPTPLQRLRLLSAMAFQSTVSAVRWLRNEAGPEIDLYSLVVHAPCCEQGAADASLFLFVHGKGGAKGQHTCCAVASSE